MFLRLFLSTIFLIATSHFAVANNQSPSDETASEIQVWSTRSQPKEHHFFTYRHAGKLLVSENCLNDKTSWEASKCDAAKALRKSGKIKLPAGTIANQGLNPASLACSQGLKQTVVVLINNNQDENSFCRFADGSMISTHNLIDKLE